LKPLIISVAGGPPAYSQQSLVTLKSFYENVRPSGVEMVWLTNDMPPEGEKRCQKYGVEVVRVKANFRDYGARNRHWHMLEWMSKNQDRGYTHVLTIDARDVAFQDNPFTFKRIDETGVLVSAEASPYGECGWNARDASRMLEGLLEHCRIYDKSWPIVNGGHVAGRFREVLWAEMTRFAIDCRGGAPTDQATLGFLSNWTNHWNTLFKIVTVSEPWICHGHFYRNMEKQAQVTGHQVRNQHGELYRLIHQWDRPPVPAAVRDGILEAYGHE
jgi:hypothetical protein